MDLVRSSRPKHRDRSSRLTPMIWVDRTYDLQEGVRLLRWWSASMTISPRSRGRWRSRERHRLRGGHRDRLPRQPRLSVLRIAPELRPHCPPRLCYHTSLPLLKPTSRPCRLAPRLLRPPIDRHTSDPVPSPAPAHSPSDFP
jgi:hypothetical protein